MPDLLKILKMPPICDGRGWSSIKKTVASAYSAAANQTGTIFFSSPLYRPNLHYQVQTKPTNLKGAIEKMGTWIKEKHM
jgi:ATP-dependent DNA helicase Q1